jgi:hypothetical protein
MCPEKKNAVHRPWTAETAELIVPECACMKSFSRMRRRSCRKADEVVEEEEVECVQDTHT